MNHSTTQESITEQLQHRETEVKHLNTVNQELQDELTKAKLRIKELEDAAEDSYYEARERAERME